MNSTAAPVHSSAEAAPDPWHRRLVGEMPRWLHRLILRFEAVMDDRLLEFSRSLPRDAPVLDAGAGECQHARVFEHCRYVGVDLAVGDVDWNYSRIDACADLSALPFRNDSFAAAINIVVLEHLRRPQEALEEIARVLRPGAPLLLIVPQEWGCHQKPHDYFRYTRFGLEMLLEQAGLEDFTIVPMGGFFTLLGRRLLDSALFFQGGWRWLAFPFVAAVAGPLGILVPFLDFLDPDKDTTLGYSCLARSRAE